MVHNKTLPQQGFIKQEEIPLHAFSNTKHGRFYTENN